MKTTGIYPFAAVAGTITLLLSGASLQAGETAPAESGGILPLPDYSGDFLERAYLLGDFGGKRS